MAKDRFLIAPFETGLQRWWTSYASPGNIIQLLKGCILKLFRSDYIDITGQRFGELVAIRPNKSGKYRGVEWICMCDCGKECTAQGGHLRAGKRLSCGCKSQKRIKETCINNIYSTYKMMAKRRSWDFQLTRIEFEKLVLGDCFYCGQPPFREWHTAKSRKIGVLYNGVDRFDSSLGYITSNCVSSCYYCNRAKGDLTYELFRQHIARIFKWQKIDF